MSLKCREASYRVLDNFYLFYSGKRLIHCTFCCITSISSHTKDAYSYRVLGNWHFKYSSNFTAVVRVWRRKSEKKSSFYKEKLSPIDQIFQLSYCILRILLPNSSYFTIFYTGLCSYCLHLFLKNQQKRLHEVAHHRYFQPILLYISIAKDVKNSVCGKQEHLRLPAFIFLRCRNNRQICADERKVRFGYCTLLFHCHITVHGLCIRWITHNIPLKYILHFKSIFFYT